MIINVTIDTENNTVWASDEDNSTSIDYSACDFSAISLTEIINDFLT